MSALHNEQSVDAPFGGADNGELLL